MEQGRLIDGALRSTALPGVSSALAYGAAAVAANFVNKHAMQVLPLPNAVLLMQLCGSMIVILLLSTIGIVDLPAPSSQRCRQLLPVAIAYGAHASLVFRSLVTLNVPMYNTLKRMAPVLVLVIKTIMDRRLPKLQIAGSVLLIVLGCIIAGLGDLAFNAHGYAVALMCAFMQALYIVLAEGLGSGIEPVKAAELLFYASALCTPIACLAASFTEADKVGPGLLLQLYQQGPTQFTFWLAAVSTIECLMSGSLILCTQLNSALTSSIVGVLKGVVAVLLGFFLLGGAPFSGINAFGISLNVLGGIWYSAIKYQQSRQIATGTGGAGLALVDLKARTI